MSSSYIETKSSSGSDNQEYIKNVFGSTSYVKISPSTDNILVNYSGRPPWYDYRGKMKEAYVIGLCGGSASGKTTVAQGIIERIKVPWVVIISLDSFYKVLTPEQHEQANNMEYDFDSPDAIDFELAYETLSRLKVGKPVKIPIYDFTTHSRLVGKYNIVYGANVIIAEGLMSFYDEKLRDLYDFKIFICTDSDVRLCRRVKRDMEDRGRSINSIMVQYTKFVKPSFDKYINPLADLADIVVPWNFYNVSAVDIICKSVKRNLINRGYVFRSELLNNPVVDDSLVSRIRLVEQNNQVKAIQTRIRDSKTDRASFVRYSNRLMKLCLIEALSSLNYKMDESKCLVIDKKICAVSIMRAGETFKEVINDTLYKHSYGKILIQTNEKSGEPEFHYLNLPNDISNTYVLLFDTTIASGAAAIMGIRILIDHDVNEEDIVMVTLLLTPTGIRAILNAFPKVTVVAGMMDDHVNSNYHIIPGFGNFGHRYFGF